MREMIKQSAILEEVEEDYYHLMSFFGLEEKMG